MIKFDIEKVQLLHRLIIESTGGVDGVRDYNLLDSAINSAFQTFGGTELYPSKEEKGARLGFNIIANHAFIDGNKRTGLLVMMSFFEINGINLIYSDEDLIKIGFSLADGSMNYHDLLSWVTSHKINQDCLEVNI